MVMENSLLKIDCLAASWEHAPETWMPSSDEGAASCTALIM